MKKLIAALALIVNAVSLHAQITAGNPELDQFNYAPTGSPVTNFTNPNGTKWILAGAPGATTAYPTINSGNLTVSGLLNPAGNSVIWGSAVSGQTGGSTSTACAVLPLTGKTSISGGTATNIFYSLAFQINTGSSVPASNGLGVFPIALVSGVTQTGQTGAPSVAGAKLYIETNKLAAGAYSIGINKGAGTAATTFFEGGNATPAVYLLNTTYFIVVEYSFSGSENGSDSVSLWVNPSTSTFGNANPPTPDVTTSSGADIVSGSGDSINGFEFRQVSSISGSMTADELSIGAQWADVTPVNPPAAASFSGLANASSAYDTTFTLTGKVSATGPIYPAKGEGVSVTINGVTENTTITDTTGDFSISYKNCNAPVGGGPYGITYSYSGPTLGAGSDSTTTLTVTGPGAVVLYGAKMYDGTANAAGAILYVSNAAPGDVVIVGGGNAGLATTKIGVETITSFTALTLGGAQAANYTLIGASGTVLIATPPFSVGQPVFDPFAYPVSDNLVGQINSQGLTWYAMGTGSSQPTIQSGTLTIPGLLSDSGNSVSFTGVSGGTTARMDFNAATNTSIFYGGSSYSVYYSMSFEVTQTADLSPTTPGFVAAFSEGVATSATAPTSGWGRLYLRQDGGGFDMGINKGDGVAGDIAWEPNIYGAYTTYFVVVAYTFSGNPGASNDSVSLWINPSSSTFGAANPPAPDVTTSAGGQVGSTSPTDKLGSFYIRNSNQFEPQGMTADELSIGLSWADVTPILSRFSITSESANANAGTITLTWQSVSGVSYHVAGSASVSTPNPWPQVGSEVTATGASTSTTVPVGSYTYFEVVSP